MKKELFMFSMMSVFGIGFLSATPMNAKDLRWDCKTPYYPLGQQSGWNYCDGREIAPAPKKEVAKPVPAAATPVAPADSDKDGVIDSKDTCPGTPAGVQVYANGCPTDTDKDGVPDYMDECQGTAEGTAVDAVGCPQTAKAIKDEGILKGVQFESGSAKLLPESKKILDEAAEILNTRNRVRAEIQGHTDNQGKPEANMTLSQRRAESVKAYLVSKGVAADRLEAKGFGQTKPLADNNTADGRSQNRRIEFKVLSR